MSDRLFLIYAWFYFVSGGAFIATVYVGMQNRKMQQATIRKWKVFYASLARVFASMSSRQPPNDEFENIPSCARCQLEADTISDLYILMSTVRRILRRVGRPKPKPSLYRALMAPAMRRWAMAERKRRRPKPMRCNCRLMGAVAKVREAAELDRFRSIRAVKFLTSSLTIDEKTIKEVSDAYDRETNAPK